MKRALLRVLVTAGAVTASTFIGVPGQAHAAEGTAVQMLAELTVSAETDYYYDRGDFEHWVDADGDGCDTRQEVLLAQTQEEPVITGDCTVNGLWYSYVDNLEWRDPSRLDVDHQVPLEEAWDSGAWEWTTEQRRDYANDLSYFGSLTAITDTVNSSKGSRDPAEWMPPYAGASCRYVQTWVAVKYRWSLTVDPTEKSALDSQLAGGCGSEPIEVPPLAGVSDSLTDTLLAGERLNGGQSLVSANGDYVLEMQDDGNFVIYAPGRRALWSSRTWGNPGAYLTFQSDGNLVIYTPAGRPIWDTRTWGNPQSRVVLQNDGNFVLYRSNGSAAWDTGWDRGAPPPPPPPPSTPYGDTMTGNQQLTGGQSLYSSGYTYSLVVQSDGNIVTYAPGQRAVWSTKTWGNPNARLVMQTDGNLVLYATSGTVLWSSNSWGNPGSRLVIQNDGNLVLYRSNGSVAWSTGWDRGATSQPPTNPQPPTTDPRFGTCAEVKSRGLGPYYRGSDPEYYWYRDSDSDGIVCE